MTGCACEPKSMGRNSVNMPSGPVLFSVVVLYGPALLGSAAGHVPGAGGGVIIVPVPAMPPAPVAPLAPVLRAPPLPAIMIAPPVPDAPTPGAFAGVPALPAGTPAAPLLGTVAGFPTALVPPVAAVWPNRLPGA